MHLQGQRLRKYFKKLINLRKIQANRDIGKHVGNVLKTTGRSGGSPREILQFLLSFKFGNRFSRA